MFVLPLCLFSPLSASPHVSASVLLSLESLREPLAPPKASHSCSGPPQGHRPPSQKTHLTSLLMWATLFPQWNRRAWAHVTTDSAAAGGAKTQSSFCVLVALWVMGSRWAVRTDGGLGEPVCWLGSARGGLFTEGCPEAGGAPSWAPSLPLPGALQMSLAALLAGSVSSSLCTLRGLEWETRLMGSVWGVQAVPGARVFGTCLERSSRGLLRIIRRRLALEPGQPCAKSYLSE